MRWDTPARAMFDKWFTGPPKRAESAAVAALALAGLRTTQQTVNRIRRGLLRPDEENWAAFRVAFGIPEIAWLTAAGRGSVRVPALVPTPKPKAA